MAFLQGKTPISFLQELCTKRGITPQYDLIANEGAVHEPTFVFKVTAGDFLGTGKGPSKKKAKHNAALSILNQMTGMTNGNVITEEHGAVVGEEGSVEAPDEGNPVGELQEMTQKRLWPPPVYEFNMEQGPPHAREFVCTIRLLDLIQQAGGKSKKLAKRNAAKQMIQLIEQGAAQIKQETEQPEGEDDDTVSMPKQDARFTYSALKEGKLPTLTPQASQTISQFYMKLKHETGKGLSVLQQQKLNLPNQNFCQLLQEIAQEQRFEATFVDLPDVSVKGKYQCLVQLSVLPIAVCYGTGSTQEEARHEAAHNALEYLRIMTKK